MWTLLHDWSSNSLITVAVQNVNPYAMETPSMITIIIDSSVIQPIAGRDNEAHPFHNGFNPKVNVIARLKFELGYNNIAVQHVSHYDTRTLALSTTSMYDAVLFYTHIFVHSFYVSFLYVSSFLLSLIEKQTLIELYELFLYSLLKCRLVATGKKKNMLTVCRGLRPTSLQKNGYLMYNIRLHW